MTVTLLAPTRQRCGIADYTRALLPALRHRVQVKAVVPADAEGACDYAALGRQMNQGNVAHVQYEHGFFLHNDDPAGNFDTFMRAVDVPVLVTLHCLPLPDARWHRWLRHPRVAFLVHSRHHHDEMHALGTTSVVRAVPHPLPSRTPSAMSATEFRVRHGLEGKTVLGIFGFIKAHKGYMHAVEALRELPAHVVLLLAGGPQDERDVHTLAAVRAHAERLGVGARCVVTGYLPDTHVGAAMEACDLVLAPFTATTASGSLATALAWERPVLASALPQHVELHDAFECLHLFNTGDQAALAQAISTLLDAPARRQHLVDAARRMREQCTYVSLADTTVALYAHLAGAPRAQTAGGH